MMAQPLPVTGRSNGMLKSFERRGSGSNALAAEQMRRELLRTAQQRAIIRAEQAIYRPQRRDGWILVPVDHNPVRLIKVSRDAFRTITEKGFQGSRWVVDETGAILTRRRCRKTHPDHPYYFDVVAILLDLKDGEVYTLEQGDVISTHAITVLCE